MWEVTTKLKILMLNDNEIFQLGKILLETTTLNESNHKMQWTTLVDEQLPHHIQWLTNLNMQP
jgi:hypothetical protein